MALKAITVLEEPAKKEVYEEQIVVKPIELRAQANLWGVILSIMFVIIGVVVIGVLVSSLGEYIPTTGPLSNAVGIAQTAIVIAAVALILYVFMGAFGGVRR